MDFTKDIYINTNKLYENSSLILFYKGVLSQNPNSKVFLHYGYDENWNNPGELRLKRTDRGVFGVLRITSGNSFQFVFRDDNNSWDNNNNSNYILPILQKEDTILEFGPDELQNQQDAKDEYLLETSIYSSNEIELEIDYSSYNIKEATLPPNTIINKVEFDDFTNTLYIKQEIVSEKSETSKEKIETIKEQTPVKEEIPVSSTIISQPTAQDDNVAVPKLAVNDITINSLVPQKETKLSKKTALYMFKKKIKLAFLKLAKLIRSALNYDENKNF